VQSGVGKLSCNKTALKRCTSTETLWNRKAPSLSSPEDEEIFLPKCPKSWHADVLLLLLLFFNYTPGSIDPRGWKLLAKSKYHWWLEVRVFVSETIGVRDQSRVEALYKHWEALEQKRLIYWYYYYYYELFFQLQFVNIHLKQAGQKMPPPEHSCTYARTDGRTTRKHNASSPICCMVWGKKTITHRELSYNTLFHHTLSICDNSENKTN